MVSAGNFISVTGGHGDADALAADQALPPVPTLRTRRTVSLRLFDATSSTVPTG